MLNVDDAIRFLLEWAIDPQAGDYSSYGYEIYLPNVIRVYREKVLKVGEPGFLGQGREAEELSPVFYDAAWEMCRRGIFRPGVRSLGKQATADGASGNGYSLTSAGREWLARADGSLFFPTDPSRFAQIVARFRDRLGDGYFQRAQEAVRCHFATAYLACCAMCGAAAESILLRVAIEKSGEADKVLRAYRSATGRRKIENIVVGQLRRPLAAQFCNMTDLLNYWRDEAAHGGISDISEFEAYEAMARLLRFAHFVDDHWIELTARPSQ